MFEKHTTEGKIFTKHKASYHMALKTIGNYFRLNRLILPLPLS